uniref:Uncharacterized protein n=1 Tax=Podoviridae sp. ctsNK10 TaxID=2826582 RepID=A0A8S5NKJ5_9CAUD|nr:MAG TPA: hypothetical protein [Podoviridae sp. ctsNK10]DAJ73315.1 MAG TPA: hypothetical protein [Caudoviricetes sp.]DAO74160.1 MAG TPA: hypothetical protein [Bacteriophage sp.]DAP66492.1 MAG TPA: hypothetical protein [Caudoviricetes sp.]DAV76814.1 MAG TPA: hypothetical protein [Caudoviricetes sp.]
MSSLSLMLLFRTIRSMSSINVRAENVFILLLLFLYCLL